jgi:UDP-N-acetylglucosamine 4,6-dehydratase/5-epimerase
VFSRDEVKQSQIREIFNEDPRLRYFLGDVREKSRLELALNRVDFVIHAAALKQVPSCESNPFEAVRTNVLGAQNLVEASIRARVKKVIALSTDKAANPANLYGATKLCSDRLFIASNVYASRKTLFSVVRYGNVLGSRGSVVPIFLRQKSTGVLTITHRDMTRFWLTINQGASFVLSMLAVMNGAELFVPKIPSMRVVDLANALCPGCELKDIGIRPGEKLHELMIPKDDARHTLEFGKFFVIKPSVAELLNTDSSTWLSGGNDVPNDFEYGSNTNSEWLSERDLARLIDKYEADSARVGAP